jgi:hypothetical protein
MSTPEAVAFSVDLEPNKDGTLNGVRDAMEWFDRTVPRGTVFATYRIATELPDLLAELAASHEIGVHVHPREFGHEHDQLAELHRERQAELISTTRDAVADAIGKQSVAINSFRAGRHSIGEKIFSVLNHLNFAVDASVNIRYNDDLPQTVYCKSEPFEYNGIIEVPTSYASLPLLSSCAVRKLMERPVTATAATLRHDIIGCPGTVAVKHILQKSRLGSFYAHPYDATDYHKLNNCGRIFRHRFERLINAVDQVETVTEVVTRRTR